MKQLIDISVDEFYDMPMYAQGWSFFGPNANYVTDMHLPIRMVIGFPAVYCTSFHAGVLEAI